MGFWLLRLRNISFIGFCFAFDLVWRLVLVGWFVVLLLGFGFIGFCGCDGLLDELKFKVF